MSLGSIVGTEDHASPRPLRIARVVDQSDLSPAQPSDEGTLPALVRAALVIGFLYLFLGGVKLLERGSRDLAKTSPIPCSRMLQPRSRPFRRHPGHGPRAIVVGYHRNNRRSGGQRSSERRDCRAHDHGRQHRYHGHQHARSLTHARQDESFRRGFAAATMHDFFNLIAVAVILPIEILTGFLSSAATSIARFISGGTELGGSFDSPIKGAVKWLAGLFESVFELFTDNATSLAVISIVVGIGFIFLTLTLITKNMRVLVADRVERSLNAALARSGIVGLVVGMLITIAVQSSSITTSILIPLVASGLLALRNAYPITLGANIGTTVTALLAALAAGALDGLTIAVTHTLFNILGILLIFPWPKIKYIPVRLAEGLADMAVKRKWLALAYVAVAFIAIPLLGIVVL